jgi:hypothetical protein
MKLSRILGGSFLCLVSLLGVLIGSCGVVDPVGIKTADDGDPFGAPPSRIELLLFTAGFAAVGALGLKMIFKHTKEVQHPSEKA